MKRFQLLKAPFALFLGADLKCRAGLKKGEERERKEGKEIAQELIFQSCTKWWILKVHSKESGGAFLEQVPAIKEGEGKKTLSGLVVFRKLWSQFPKNQIPLWSSLCLLLLLEQHPENISRIQDSIVKPDCPDLMID